MASGTVLGMQVEPEYEVSKSGVVYVIKPGNWFDLRRKTNENENPLIQAFGKSVFDCKNMTGFDVQGQMASDVPAELSLCSKIEILGFSNQRCKFNPNLEVLGDILKKLRKLEVFAIDCTNLDQGQLDKVLDMKLNKNPFNYFSFSVSKDVDCQNPVVFYMPQMLLRPTLGTLDFYGSSGVSEGCGFYCGPGQVALDIRLAFLTRSNNAEDLRIGCPSGVDANFHYLSWEQIKPDLLVVDNKFKELVKLYKFICDSWLSCPVELIAIVVGYLDDSALSFLDKYGFQVAFPSFEVALAAMKK